MFNTEDDDGQEDTGVTAARYACMPSLVTLQQMRNRLHLAYTGQKLMKWTALATGRELRKLAKELYEQYQSFRDDMREGYILLARARYSNPCFNDAVLETVGQTDANIKAHVTTKSISGVKVLQMHIIDNYGDNYANLGLGRGGEVVTEAKRHWRELLKNVLVMCQQRMMFMTLETAHKNATKRKQLISKVVIPKLKATVRYIQSELEEKEREDTFRLKRFKQLKTKRSEKNKKTDVICEKCFCKYQPKNEKHDCPVCNPPTPKPPKDDDKAGDHFKPRVENITEQKKEVPCEVECINTLPKKPSVPKIMPKPPSCESGKALVARDSKKASSTAYDVASPCPTRNSSKASAKSECKPCEEQPSDKSIPRKELGTFVNKFKEIIKVTRHQNYDGTITEEKQVITIRTEKRSPRRSTCDNQSSEKSFKSRGGYDCSSCHNVQPRATKSEQNRCKHQMGEPSVRSCASSNKPVNRHRTPCSGSYDDLSMNSRSRHSSCNETKNSCTMTAKSSQRNKMPSSSASSLSSRVGGRNGTKSKTNCCGNKTCLGNLPKNKLSSAHCCGVKSVATNDATRDASISTSNLGKKSSNQRKTSFLIGACTSCPSFSMQPRLQKLPPSSKSCSYGVDDEVEIQKKLECNPKLIENLKNIFRRSSSANKPYKVLDTTDSVETQDETMTSRACQAQADSDEEIEITQCDSCGSITIRSCKSTGIDTSSRNKVKEKGRHLVGISDRNTKSNKSIRLDVDDDEDIRRDMAQTAKSYNSICRSKRKQSNTCPACPRDSCVSCSSQNVKYKDVSTNTRRSARYDVRGVASMPIRLQAKKKSTTELKNCTCRSDNTMIKNKEKGRPIRAAEILPDIT